MASTRRSHQNIFLRMAKFFQDLFNFSSEQEKIPVIFLQQVKSKGIVDRPVPVDNNIPESSHRVDLFLHFRCEQAFIYKVNEDILIFPGYSQVKIRILG